ncbi:MAG TPA: metallophosphoesterase, partial [Nitrospirota bacterium]|nr:metallophosphoesterase [Nitrospirota bacterium]
MWHKISKASHTFFFLLFSFIVILLIGTGTVLAVEKAYYHFVILGDPHLPGKYINSKEHVIQDINTWVDVDGVVAMGDICEISGTVGEYVIAKNFFKSLNKSLFPIVGNHDYIYDDRLSTTGHHKKAAQSTRAAKLLRFQETFDLTEIYYTKRAGNYL